MVTNAVLAAISVASGLVLLDRLLLALERRGWIYWRRSRGSSGSLGNAMLDVQKILEPSKRHVVEERRRSPDERPEDGDPPKPRGS